MWDTPLVREDYFVIKDETFFRNSFAIYEIICKFVFHRDKKTAISALS